MAEDLTSLACIVVTAEAMHASEHAGCSTTIVGTTCVQRLDHACQITFLW